MRGFHRQGERIRRIQLGKGREVSTSATETYAENARCANGARKGKIEGAKHRPYGETTGRTPIRLGELKSRKFRKFPKCGKAKKFHRATNQQNPANVWATAEQPALRSMGETVNASQPTQSAIHTSRLDKHGAMSRQQDTKTSPSQNTNPARHRQWNDPAQRQYPTPPRAWKEEG